MIAAAVALTACQSGSAQDCKVRDQQAPQCLERFRGKSDREILLGCFPFSQPQRISGAWVSGFETNEFYEGEQASPALINKETGDTELEIDGVGRAGPHPTVFQIEFIGWRSQCDMGLPHHIIIVDRVISKQDRSAG
jgi:hypothetical protein